jgi:transposase
VGVDALGNPVRLVATAGQVADVTQGEALIAGLGAEHVIADKGYDSDRLIATIEAEGAEAVIPPRSNRKEPRAYAEHLYKERNLVERFLNKVKNCRRVATRYEKTARNYLAFWQSASIMILLA